MPHLAQMPRCINRAPDLRRLFHVPYWYLNYIFLSPFRPFRSEVWIRSHMVVCLGLWSDRFYASVLAASGREPDSRSGQRMSECVLRRRLRGSACHSVHVCSCGEESRPAKRSIPFRCGPDSSGGRAGSTAFAGAVGGITSYNRPRY